MLSKGRRKDSFTDIGLGVGVRCWQSGVRMRKMAHVREKLSQAVSPGMSVYVLWSWEVLRHDAALNQQVAAVVAVAVAAVVVVVVVGGVVVVVAAGVAVEVAVAVAEAVAVTVTVAVAVAVSVAVAVAAAAAVAAVISINQKVGVVVVCGGMQMV